MKDSHCCPFVQGIHQLPMVSLYKEPVMLNDEERVPMPWCQDTNDLRTRFSLYRDLTWVPQVDSSDVMQACFAKISNTISQLESTKYCDYNQKKTGKPPF